jgi:hypothetical protein
VLEWLLASIDSTRAHDVGFEAAWHARLMVLAWSLFIPAGIIVARFFKVTARQDWPNELDNRSWWFAHLFFQYSAGVLVVIAVVMIWPVTGNYEGSFWHRLFGWITVTLCGLQFLAGWFRGTRGGPSELELRGTIRGDHFDMTRRRKIFEYLHKSVGYLCLLLSIVAVFSGLWMTNAPRWMWIFLILWWPLVICYFVYLQRLDRVIDTYQAIWGPDPDLPGNSMKPIGIGIKKRS